MRSLLLVRGRCCAALLTTARGQSWRVAGVLTSPQPAVPAAAAAAAPTAATTRGAAASAGRRARAARATAAVAASSSPSSPSSPRPSATATTSSKPPAAPLPPTLDLGLPPASNAKVRTAVYRGSAVRLEDCPPEDPKRPEVAVIGRSNVGKSSLINALTASKGLAMVSKSPGKTRTINHFLVNDGWWLVDLPGYGYAKTAKTTREAFDAFSRDFLSRRRSLAMVLLLVDASVPPQRVDLEYAGWLAGSGVPFAVVFTKTDKRPKKGSAAAAAGAKAAARAGSAAAAAAADEEDEDEELDVEEDDAEEQAEAPPAAAPAAPAAAPTAATTAAQTAATAAAPGPPPRAASASPHALAFLRALADEQGFRLLPPSMATSASTGAGTAEVLRFVSSVRLGFLQRRKEAKAEVQRRAMEADDLKQQQREEDKAAAAAAGEAATTRRGDA